MSRRVRVVAWSLVALSVLLIAIDLVIVLTTPPLPGSWPAGLYIPVGIAGLAFPLVGALIASRRPAHRIGWLLLAFGVANAAHVATQSYRDLAVIKAPGFWAGGELAAWGAGVLLLSKMSALVLLVLLYPDGRPVSRLWRWLTGVIGAYLAVNLTVYAFSPGEFPDFPRVENPFGVSGAIGGFFTTYVKLGCGQWLWPIALALGSGSLLVRYRQAGWRKRQQIKWFIVGVTIAALAVLMVVLAQGAGPEDVTRPGLLPVAAALVLVATIALPAAIGYALLRHQLLDINLVVSRSLVYAVLTFLIGAAYFGTAAMLGIAAGARSQVAVAVLVTVIAILAFQPLRRRLDRAAARLVYGQRLSGYELLTEFGEVLGHAFEPAELAAKVSQTVREGLHLHWVRVSLESQFDGQVVREIAGVAGVAPDDTVLPEKVVELRHGGQVLGAIECGPKAEGTFVAADEQLLETLARQAALAFHNGRLASELAARLDEIRRQAGELAASRVRILKAQDVERRRLERDIHDGLQQEIVALAAKLRLARNQLRRDVDLADGTLTELQEEAQWTLESIRKLAHGIHPAVLTDQGLLEAIDAQAGRLAMPVVIDASPSLQGIRFPDEIEATIYFVVSEALANALKHASARRLTVRLDHRDGALEVEVVDDGTGFVPADAVGTGLTGMRDRVESLRGRMRVVSAPGRGTRIAFSVPTPIASPTGSDLQRYAAAPADD